MDRLTRRQAMHVGLTAISAGVGGIAAGTQRHASQSTTEFSFHHDHILGTSLDCWIITTTSAQANVADHLVLEEIERLRRIFSTHDPDSELSRLNQASSPFPASEDMLCVLRSYELWNRRSAGACSAQIGAIARLWSECDRTMRGPDKTGVANIVEQLARPGWHIDGVHQTVTRLNDLPLNLNSIAKGFIIAKSADVVRANVPDLVGMLINLGGDLLAWGSSSGPQSGWRIGIQDPHLPHENARPLTALRLLDRAVASSGGYERYVTVAGQRRSHLIDPRTGQPATGVASATVVAPTSHVANALATILCVLDPKEGLQLVAGISEAECLLVTPDGKQLRTDGFSRLELPMAAKHVSLKGGARPLDPRKDIKRADAWPANHQVTIALEIPKPTTGRKIRRPYVAVWIEGADVKQVRTITVWGNSSRWLPTMTGWWGIAKKDRELIKAVTRATRSPGKYTVVWDGKDNKGQAVPQGTYTIRVEVHREHGKHVYQKGKIDCGTRSASVTLEKNAETEETVVEYGKKK